MTCSGTVETGQQVDGATYARALRRQRELRTTVGARLCQYDAVVMLAVTGTAPPGIKTGNPVDHLVLGLPGHRTAHGPGTDGLPLGMQLVGVPEEEDSPTGAGRRRQYKPTSARPALAAGAS